MLTHLQSYREQLLSFLYIINGNVDWNRFLNENAGRDPIALLKRIKPLVWTDKTIPSTDDEHVSFHIDCASLIGKCFPMMRPESISYVMDVSPSASTRVSDIIIRNASHKVSVLVSALSVMGVRCRRINDEMVVKEIRKTDEPKKVFLFTTASITYADPHEVIQRWKTNETVVMVDTMNNVYRREHEKELLRFVLTVLQLMSPDCPEYDELLRQEYGLVDVNVVMG